LTGSPRPTLLCLLPARNCAEDLPAYFDSVRTFADGVIALDDGSTDDTPAILAAEPMVKTLLRKPSRHGYGGWDDLRNRNDLLEAAEEFDADWLIFLDADERIPFDDGQALRSFLQTGADPELAYLFRVYRMVGDLSHYDRTGPWVGRLFAHRTGLRLDGPRLHLVPIPSSIPRDRWRRTTLRIQHLAGLTETRRRARYEKYVEADPSCDEQASYAHLRAAPLPLRPWWPRPPDLAVLANEPMPMPISDGDGPEISVIVIAQDDAQEIDEVMGAVFAQRCSAPFEVIVVTSGSDGTASIVRERYPNAKLIELDHPVYPGAARNVALRVARGRFITCADSHIVLEPGALEVQLAAHRRGYALVTGAAENGTFTASGWASYFLDHYATLPGGPAGQLGSPPVRCAFPAGAIDALGGFREDMRAASDTVMIGELYERGYSAWLDPATVMVHRSRCRTVGKLLPHHFARGRGMGRILVDRALESGRLPPPRFGRFVMLNVPARLRHVTRRAWSLGPKTRRTYLRVSPLVAAGAVSWWLGAIAEVVQRAPRARAMLNPEGDPRSRSWYHPATLAARAAASQGRQRSN
jgi:glycosyltransferase involved in cell wall biosynthesis